MEPIPLLTASLAFGGLAGSLINVFATRLPHEEDLAAPGLPLRPGSHRADAFALVPYAGAWDSSGRRVDWPKLGTDVAAALITATALWRYGVTFDGLRGGIFALVLLLILRIDWQNHLIFLVTIVPGLAVALGLNALDSPGQLLWSAVAAIAAGVVFLLFFLLALMIYRTRALGLGDIWLAALIGAMTVERAGGALLLGMFLAAAGGLFLIAIRVRSRTDYIPYGAYLCLGAMIVVL